jgi:hypothetical protein
MAGHGIHVHGAHDHAVEHEAQKGGLGQQVAIFSAVLATVGAVVSFLGGHTQNEALYHKNEAVLYKTQASNMWNYYQAKSTKQNLAEFAAGLASDPAAREKFNAQVKRYETEKEAIKKDAESLEAKSKAANEAAEHALHPHNKLAMSMTLLQIAIALASITVLTQKRWLLVGAGLSAFGGAVLGIVAWF